MVKHLSYDILPDVYLQQLESAYGTVQDGEELYTKFMDTYQNHGEKPSAVTVSRQAAEVAETKSIFKEAFKLAPGPGVGHPGAEQDQLCPAKKKLPVHCSELQSTSSIKKRVPKGLVGSRCTADIIVAGHQGSCLLDTGSQVTTIPVSFYNEHLSDQPVQPLHELLHVEVAAGQNVPYLGYIETTVTFSRRLCGQPHHCSHSCTHCS